MCTFDDGERANIEMQAFKQEYNYGKRAEYYVARLIGTKYPKGTLWSNVAKAYQISVLDFEFDKSTREAVSRYAMRTKDGRNLADLLNIIFLELPKLAGKEENIEANTSLENWGIFLKEADNPKKANVIKNLTDKEEGIMAAEAALSYISGDRVRWIRQFQQEMAEMDIKSSFDAVAHKNWTEGKAEGKAEGKTEVLLDLVKSKLLSAAEAARRLNISESDLQKLLDEK